MLALAALLAAPPFSQAADGYWQQRVSYVVDARLDEESGVLSGAARVTYVNQSPDTLDRLYFHLHLNAFRPGSRWAAAERAEGIRRFGGLADPWYGFERLTRAAIMGSDALPRFPHAPDSTVVEFLLPRLLAPGDSLVAELEWQARPSYPPRRQGRLGRRFDLAHWYPRIAVYDRKGWQAHPLYPAGEFYGEFGDYDVRLDVPEDQVIGATGLPACGDPGWSRTAAGPIDYQPDWYGAWAHAPGRSCDGAVAGRKRVRFVARDVHHFALTMNPDYRYEEGRYGDVVVRVLYLPEERATWGNGRTVGHVVEALRWLDDLFGPYPWPQLTFTRRLDRGATEFPMMVMAAGSSLSLALHEVGHNYLMGVLANNERTEAWLDEGFSNFQTTWYLEQATGSSTYHRTETLILLDWDLAGRSEPVALPGEEFPEYEAYRRMTYTKGELFFLQLRYVVGDKMMRRILREYYRRWKLRHVDETAFRTTAEDVTRMDLGWLFGQWLHATPLYDYALESVRRKPQPDGTWRTTITVRRLADGMMPVEIAVGDRIVARASGRQAREEVTVMTAAKPGRIVLDPRVMTHDYDMLNNRERGLRWAFSRLDHDAKLLATPFSTPARRDATVWRFFPTLWHTAAGGETVGLWTRSNYLGRFNRLTALAAFATRDVPDQSVGNAAVLYLRIADPVRAYRPWTERWGEFGYLEGRVVLGGGAAWERPSRLTDATRRRAGASLRLVTTVDTAWLDPSRWEDAGTAEVEWFAEWQGAGRGASWRVRAGGGPGAAFAHHPAGAGSLERRGVELYWRGEVVGRARVALGEAWSVGIRGYTGGYAGEGAPVRQRRIPVAGADPYATLLHPLLRSQGAYFTRSGFQYHAPGGANIRGFDPSLGGRWALSGTLELERVFRFAGDGGPFRRVAGATFVDAGLVDARGLPSTAGDGATALLNWGVGVRAEHRVGQTAFVTRLDLPLVVSRPEFAHDPNGRRHRFDFRWAVSLEAAL